MRLRWRLRRRRFLLAAAAVLGFALPPSAANAQDPGASAEAALFDRHCAGCHPIPATRAPDRPSLSAMPPNFIVDALANGMMKAQGAVLTPEERVALAEYLTGRKVGADAPRAGKCAAPRRRFRSTGRCSTAGARMSKTGGFSRTPASAPPIFLGSSSSGRSACPARYSCSG